MNLNPHLYRIYLRVWYVIFDVKKCKASISFLHFFGFWGLLTSPLPAPLVTCECIYFCAKVRIWIDLGEKYATKFGLLIIQKNAYF